MKVDNTFDKTELLRCLRHAYGVPLESIAFLPEGEDSYGYIVVSETGRKYFAKASTSVPETCLRAASVLQRTCGISGVVGPLETSDGELSVAWQGFRVSLFPFIEGQSRWDLWRRGEDFTDTALRQTASLLAAVHGCAGAVETSRLAVRGYDLPSRRELDRVLAAGERGSGSQNIYQTRLLEALTAHRSEILATLARYDELGRSAAASAAPLVVTHGDPTPGNLILDPAQEVHLIDWDGVALGPAERDLVSFTGERFDVVLESYLEARAKAQKGVNVVLHPDIFGFYIYEWTVNEIRDYGTKILFKNSAAEQNRYDWDSLQDYLPPNQALMEDGIAAVQEILGRYGVLSTDT